MATKLELRNYAEKNNCTLTEARQHFINQAKQANLGDTCQLLILKRDSRDGSVEFMHGVVSIPKNSKIARNDAIGSLGGEWGHDGRMLCMVSEYLSHSPTLSMAREGIIAADSFIMTPAGSCNIDLNNLGCYIEFDVDYKGVSTKGPQWLDPSDVKVKAAEIAKTYADSHDVKYHTAA